MDKVFKPGTDRIFVFGSNLAGIHGAGAAHTARMFYGAVQEVPEGLSGSSYAIPTKNEHLQTLLLSDIELAVDRFIKFASENLNLYFFVTRIGCGLAGYVDAEIAPLFAGCPPNVELPYGWGNLDEVTKEG